MEPLINVIALWLSLTFSLPTSADHPQVRYVMPERLAAIYSDSVAGGGSGLDVMGVYDSRARSGLFAL